MQKIKNVENWLKSPYKHTKKKTNSNRWNSSVGFLYDGSKEVFGAVHIHSIFLKPFQDPTSIFANLVTFTTHGYFYLVTMFYASGGKQKKL